MLDTSRLQVNGGVEPSSKNDRGTAVVVGRLYVVLVNEVAEAMLGGCSPGREIPFAGLLFLLLLPGEAPLMESIEVDGDRAPLNDVRLRFCDLLAIYQALRVIFFLGNVLAHHSSRGIYQRFALSFRGGRGRVIIFVLV